MLSGGGRKFCHTGIMFRGGQIFVKELYLSYRLHLGGAIFVIQGLFVGANFCFFVC